MNDVESPITVERLEGYYRIDLGKYAQYIVYTSRNRIECFAEDFESFFSTIFNLPFSIFFMTRDEVLLHACSMYYNGGLICFAGNKGVGKSTLSHLLDGDDFRLYSDDTLRISNNVGYRAHNLMKLTQETVDKLSVKDILGVRNVAGKAYRRLISDHFQVPLKAIILLKRNSHGISMNIVEDELSVKKIYCSNIVGVSMFDSYLLKRLLLLSRNICCPVFELNTPESLRQLISCRDSIIRLLRSYCCSYEAEKYEVK